MGVLDGDGSTPSPNDAENGGDGTIAFSISLGSDRREKQRRSVTDRRATASDGSSDDPPDGVDERRTSDRRTDDDRRTGPTDRRSGSLFTLSLDGHGLDDERRTRATGSPVDDFPLDDEDVLAQTLIEPLDPILPLESDTPSSVAASDVPDADGHTVDESRYDVAGLDAAPAESPSPSVAPIPVIGDVEPPSSSGESNAPAATADPNTPIVPDPVRVAETTPATEAAATPASTSTPAAVDVDTSPTDPAPTPSPSTTPDPDPDPAAAPEPTAPAATPDEPAATAAPTPAEPTVATSAPSPSTTSAGDSASTSVPGHQPIQPALAPTHRVPDQSAGAVARREAARRAVLASNATVTPVRAVRRRRSGSGFGLLFSLLVLVALIGGGVMFGRDLLFPGDWDDAAKPYADAVAVVRGVEFVDPFTVTVEPTTEYRPRVERQLLGEWEFDLPLWRAFGLAPGTVDEGAIDTLVDGRSPALYSHLDGQIYVDDASSPFERDARITRAAVEASLDQEFGWSADHAARSLDDRALVDAHVRARAAVVQSASIYSSLVSAPPEVPLDALPAVLDFRLTAPLVFAELLPTSVTRIDVAGATLDATGAPITSPDGPPAVTPTGVASGPIDDPLARMGTEGPGPVFQSPYTDGPEAVLAEGDSSAGARLQLDPAVWFMSFAAYTDPATADAMTDAVTAASVHPVTNAGVRCWLATFETASPTANATLVAGLDRWVAAAAPASSASVGFLPDGSPQLRTCDPGPAFESPAAAGLARQLIAYRATELATITTIEASGVTNQPDITQALERVKAAGVAERAAALPAGTNPAELAAQIADDVAAVLNVDSTAEPTDE